ncbi:MAG: diguanylate cyclase, partial [Oscillospiraceae bacterium]
MELYTGEGPYGLPCPKDDTYQECLSQLVVGWHQLEHEIDNVRNGKDNKALLALSETYFELANETVFAADNYANRQAQQARWLIVIIVAITAGTWLGILLYNTKHLRRLEKDNRGLSDIAYIDKLTGAPNFEKFKLDAQDLLLHYRYLNFAVLYVDFENFKALNDVFGHAYGDQILQQYAKILHDDMGKLDVFCRISADKFLILRNYTEKEQLKEQQQAVDSQISSFAMSATNKQHFIRTSCGFCCLEDVLDEVKITDIIEHANFARKTAKLHSAQNYIFYNESLRQKMLAEKSIENHMQSALENGEFKVYFQPKVSLETGKIACAEALSRWITEDGNIISPAEFIPIFEKNLFIVPLDQYVLKQVCCWLRHRLDNCLS